MTRTTTAVTEFTAATEQIATVTLVRLPAEASASLPSRGQVAVQATIDGRPSRTVVEPDGARGHWLRVDDVRVGVAVAVTLEVVGDWPEPEVPSDLASELASAPETVQDLWTAITPMARWEWVRWVDATANPATRARRVEVTISKMSNGKRRPCCFDLSACTDPAVATSGRLRGTPPAR